MWTIIQEYLEKINTYLEEELSLLDVYSLCLTICLITGGFIFLGFKEFSTQKPIVYKDSQGITDNNNQNGAGNAGLFVASKNGKTYFFTWCKGVERIKKSNKIYFETEEEARSSGRTRSKTCTQ